MFTRFKAPIYGTVVDLPVLILGVFDDGEILVIDSEGFLERQTTTGKAVKADARFDFGKREWVDLPPMPQDGS